MARNFAENGSICGLQLRKSARLPCTKNTGVPVPFCTYASVVPFACADNTKESPRYGVVDHGTMNAVVIIIRICRRSSKGSSESARQRGASMSANIRARRCGDLTAVAGISFTVSEAPLHHAPDRQGGCHYSSGVHPI